MKKVESKNSYSLYEGWISVISNTLLFILKYWAGISTGSLALVADAWHTFTDSLSSVIVIISSYMGAKPADKEHPFGHGRADLINSLVIGVLLGFIGFEFISKSVVRLYDKQSVHFGTLAIVVTVISIIVKELLAQYAFYVARKSSSEIVKADAWHHRTDALSSLIVLAGIFLGRYFWWIDGVMGILISLMIFYVSFEIIINSFNRLMGETPDNDIINEIEKILKEMNFDVHPHHFHMHKYGSHIELTFHILMDEYISLKDAHEATTRIENAIRDKLDMETTIHTEPFDTVDTD
ncbi:MAG: cation transporter [Deltaproteobacteria bacterium]|nr:cation transporter [Deltaproteobacteria bacterium]